MQIIEEYQRVEHSPHCSYIPVWIKMKYYNFINKHLNIFYHKYDLVNDYGDTYDTILENYIS